MATRQQLRQRWQTADGQSTVSAIMDELQHGVTAPQLREITGTLPYSDEVSPRLDLRGFPFKKLFILRDLDLSGARLDYAVFGGNLSNCRMVETVLDGVEAVNLTMRHDFTRASFIKANVKGAHFLQSLLVEANFTQARLQSGSLKEAICVGAIFRDADLRFIVGARADFRNADLSGADLTEASLGGIRFNERTILAGTILAGAGMDRDFRAYAQDAGAILVSQQGGFELAAFDATLTVLQQWNSDSHLDAIIAAIAPQRERVVENPSYDWVSPLEGSFSPAIIQEVLAAFQEASSDLPHYA